MEQLCFPFSFSLIKNLEDVSKLGYDFVSIDKSLYFVYDDTKVEKPKKQKVPEEKGILSDLRRADAYEAPCDWRGSPDSLNINQEKMIFSKLTNKRVNMIKSSNSIIEISKKKKKKGNIKTAAIKNPHAINTIATNNSDFFDE
jgi:hypothetical protein